ncbi:hypothetical protein JL721_4144 [Aureococcus anophagefferens]|nr:hypothetical protein JL721_4144 [Aureococcus anophagefferens]
MASWKLELPTRRRASSSLGEGPPGLDLDDITLAPSASAAPPAGQPWLKGLLSFCLAPVAAPHPVDDGDGERSADSLRKASSMSFHRCLPKPAPKPGPAPPRRRTRRRAVLILLRHGESEWNASDRFTGWMDVGLTELGKREAAAAGRTLKATGLGAIDDLHSSALGRTVDTLSLCVEALGRRLPTGEAAHGHAGDAPRLTYCRSWQLNERHYGHLTGMAKGDAREKYGANQVQRWRRAWRETPPRMAPDHAARPGIAAAYAAAGGSPKDLPCSESLAATETRVVAYLENRILPQLSRGRTVLVAAHNNVIRTIIHHLDGGEEERADLELQLAALEIPYATPLVYTFALPGGPTGKLYPFADTRDASQNVPVRRGAAHSSRYWAAWVSLAAAAPSAASTRLRPSIGGFRQ